jgi:CHRD domain/SnoaL-like domain
VRSVRPFHDAAGAVISRVSLQSRMSLRSVEKPIDLVSRSCAAWANDLDAEDLAAFFTDDAVYHNILFEPVTGRENIADNIASFIRPGPPGIERGTLTLTASQAAAMRAGGTYVNIHTLRNRNGEIRGQVNRVS